jgi:hypothetical protein
MDRRARIARRLGGPATRRRRHRRVAVGVLVLAVLAAGLIVVGGAIEGDDGGDGDERAETAAEDTPTTEDAPRTVEEACLASNEQIGIAQRALLRDNPAPNAIPEFLGDAFVDLARERAATIRSLDPPPDVLAIVDAHDAVVDAIEADPEAASGMENPFAEVNQRWRDAGLDECVIDASTVKS